jgi:drug/metabolite transporter (DMT)-like permease
MPFFRWLYNQPILLLLLATLFWAGNAIAGKMAVGHISAFLLTSLRWLTAFILLLPFAVPHLKRDWSVIRSRLVLLFMLGFVGFSGFNNLMYSALTKTSAINVVIIQSALPLFVFILNMLLFRLRATRFQYFGFALSALGVAIVTFRGDLIALSQWRLNSGDALMILAVAAYGLYSVALRNKPDIHWLSTLTVLSGAAFLSSMPVTVLLSAYDFNWPDITGLLVVLYTAIFSSLAAQAFWMRSVELIGSNATSIYINLVPLFGALLAILILGEAFHRFHAVGFGLVIGGVIIAQSRTSKDCTFS